MTPTTKTMSAPTEPSSNPTDLLSLIAHGLRHDPSNLRSIVDQFVSEERIDYLAAARAAGFLDSEQHHELALATVPLLSSTRPEAVQEALDWMTSAHCADPRILTRALMTAKSHFRELIHLGADPNRSVTDSGTTPLGTCVTNEMFDGFCAMLDATSPALPLVSRNQHFFEYAFARMTPSIARMVDYALNVLPANSPHLQSLLATSVLRFADRRRSHAFVKTYDADELDAILHLVERSGSLTACRPTAWLSLFNVEFEFADLPPTTTPDPGNKLIKTILNYAHPERSIALLTKAARDGFPLDQVYIQDNDRSSPPLHYCAHNGNAEMARLLLDAGADPLALDSRGHTALAVARQADQHDIEQAILASQASNAIRAHTQHAHP